MPVTLGITGLFCSGLRPLARGYALGEFWGCLPGCSASLQTCSREVMGCSSGACSTMVMLPTMQSMQPTIPNTFRRSFRTMCASTALQAHSLYSPRKKLTTWL